MVGLYCNIRVRAIVKVQWLVHFCLVACFQTFVSTALLLAVHVVLWKVNGMVTLA